MTRAAIRRRDLLAAGAAMLAVPPAPLPAGEATARGDGTAGYLDRRSPVFTRRCVASSSSPLATRVGLRVLGEGGTAADAAVAMAGMMAVAEPMMSGLGGDTMILVWSARDRRVFGINGSGRAPSGVSFDRVGGGPFMPVSGAASVTIPGAVDGWCRLLERFGSMPLETLWADAVGYASEGYPVGESIAGFWAEAAGRLPAGLSAELRGLVLPGGEAPRPGQLVRFPQLAKTIERVAREGRAGFYAGPVAEAIAGTISAGGVPTTMEDLAEQRGEWVEPISVGFRGRSVLGLPPNSQSVVALLALGILDGFDLAAMDESTRLHHEIEALRLGFAFAIDAVGEPSPEMTTRVESALSPDSLAAARGRIGARATLPVRAEAGNSSDTSYVCAVDRDGNAVSLMTSICGAFGSGLLAGTTGVILNNRASQFSTRRGHPNALAPRRRPRHTILPGMVLRDGVPEFVLGCIGLNNHPQGQVQTLVNVLDLGMNPQQAVDAPRFRVVMTTDELQLDERLHARVGHELASRGHRLGDPQAFKGAAQMVRVHDGRGGVGPCLETGVDHRLDGVALGW